MSTVMQGRNNPLPSSGRPPIDKRQLQHDRWVAATVVGIIIVMMALLVWIASMGGGVPAEGIDYWHLMP